MRPTQPSTKWVPEHFLGGRGSKVWCWSFTAIQHRGYKKCVLYFVTHLCLHSILRETFTFTIKTSNSYSWSLNYSLCGKIYHNYACTSLFQKFGLVFKLWLTRYKEPIQGDVSYFPAVFNHMKWCIYMGANMLGWFICIIGEPVIKGLNKSFSFHFWNPIVLYKKIPFERCQDSFK